MSYNITKPSVIQIDECINLSTKSWEKWFNGDLVRIAHGVNYIYKQYNNNCVFIAELDGIIMGYIIFNKHWNRVHIDDVFVKEDMRHKDVASALITAVERKCIDSHIYDIFSDCDDTNIASIKLHLKSGFLIYGTLSNLWDDGHNSVCFRKKL